MKKISILSILLILALMNTLFAQENESIEEIVIDSNLFKQPNKGSYDFSVSNGSFLRGVDPEEIKNINEVISIKKD